MPSKKALILPITVLALIFGFLATATSTFPADKERLLYSFCPVNPYECINGCPVEVAIAPKRLFADAMLRMPVKPK